jgi:hypothetical protein
MSEPGIFVKSTRFRRSRHVRFAPIASEPSHRSDSTRCASLRTHASQQKRQRGPFSMLANLM